MLQPRPDAVLFVGKAVLERPSEGKALHLHPMGAAMEHEAVKKGVDAESA